MGKGYHVTDDAQTRPPLDTCERCGAELRGAEAEEDDRGRVYCPACRTELATEEFIDRVIKGDFEAAADFVRFAVSGDPEVIEGFESHYRWKYRAG